jgi:hypothetical protein
MQKSETYRRMAKAFKGRCDLEVQLNAGVLTDFETVMCRSMVEVCEGLARLYEKEEAENRTQRSKDRGQR